MDGPAARAVVAAALVAATLLAYRGLGDHEFLNYDDRTYVVENPAVLAPLGAEGLRAAFAPSSDTWAIPLTWLSYQLDRELAGLSAPAMLRTNVWLHAASSVLLFLAFTRMTRSIPGALWASAFVAAVFALHPLHVESVAWVSERKDTLSGFFFAAALLAYAAYAERPERWRRAIAVLACFTAALLSKASAVVLPLVLLLLDFWPLGRLASAAGRRRAVTEKLPLLALSVVAGSLAIAVQRGEGTMAFGDQLAPSIQIANAVEACAAYLVDAVWPAGLAAFYPYPTDVLSLSRAGAMAAVGLAISAFCFARARKAPWLVVGWLWFGVTVAPTLGLIQVGVQGRADRYMYLPLIGLALALAFAVAAAARGARARRVAGAVGLLACVAMGWATAQQTRYWRDTITLFERAVAVTNGNAYAHNALANALVEASRGDAAEAHYARAAAFAPDWDQPHRGRAALLRRRGDLEASLGALRTAVRLDPDRAVTRLELGATLLALGRPRAAEPELARALTLDPELEAARSALAEAHRRSAAAGQASEHRTP